MRRSEEALGVCLRGSSGRYAALLIAANPYVWPPGREPGSIKSMNRVMRVATVLAVTSAMAGCGSSLQHSATSVSHFPTAGDIAIAAHMSHCEAKPFGPPGGSAVSCSQGSVFTFDSPGHMNEWQESYSIGLAGRFIVGPNFVVGCVAKAWCARTQSNVGGSLR